MKGKFLDPALKLRTTVESASLAEDPHISRYFIGLIIKHEVQILTKLVRSLDLWVSALFSERI